MSLPHAAFIEYLASQPTPLEVAAAQAGYLTLRYVDALFDEGVALPQRKQHRIAASAALAELPSSAPPYAALFDVLRAAEAPAGDRVESICRAVAGYARELWAAGFQGELAFEAFRAALRYCPEDLIPVERLGWLAEAARIALRVGRLTAARALTTELRESAVRLRELRYQATAMIYESEFALDAGNAAQAERSLGEALDMARRCGSREVEAHGLYMSAVAAGRSGRNRDAARLSFAAYKLAMSEQLRMAALITVATSLAERGYFDAATHAYRLVLRLRPSSLQRATVLVGLVRLAALRRDEASFDEYLGLALDASLTPMNRGVLYVDAAAGLLALDRPREARRFAQLAASIAEEHGFAQLARDAAELLESIKSAARAGTVVRHRKHRQLDQIGHELRLLDLGALSA